MGSFWSTPNQSRAQLNFSEEWDKSQLPRNGLLVLGAPGAGTDTLCRALRSLPQVTRCTDLERTETRSTFDFELAPGPNPRALLSYSVWGVSLSNSHQPPMRQVRRIFRIVQASLLFVCEDIAIMK